MFLSECRNGSVIFELSNNGIPTVAAIDMYR